MARAAGEVQAEAATAWRDGLELPDLHALAKLGARGQQPGNVCTVSLRTACCKWKATRSMR
eukprot:9753139-Alexandrium_andersonii.AAC.1